MMLVHDVLNGQTKNTSVMKTKNANDIVDL